MRPRIRKSARTRARFAPRCERLEPRQLLAFAPSAWHNTVLPEDVSGDGEISPRDALLVINDLNQHGPRPASGPRPSAMLDVNADQYVSAGDALWVINRLNRTGAGDVFGQAPAKSTPAPAVRATSEGGVIRGVKWNDLNGDGVRSEDEPGLPGWRILLDKDQDGSFDAFTHTDANGYYEFNQLPVGDYTVAEVAQDGWAQTFPQGSLEFARFEATGAITRSVVAADLRGSSHLDLVVSNELGDSATAGTSDAQSTLSLLFGDGSGGISPLAPDIPLAARLEKTVALDIDSDGDPDLVAALGRGLLGPSEDENSLLIFENLGSSGFSPRPSRISLNGSPLAVVVADVDQDGHDDLVVSTQSRTGNLSVLFNDGMGKLQPLARLTVADHPVAVAALDLDGDGKQELAVADFVANKVTLYRNVDGRTFKAGAAMPVPAGPGDLLAADLNGDGVQDLAVVSFLADEVSLYFGAGNGAFGETTKLELRNGARPQAIAAADWDADGDLDLAVAESETESSSQLSVFLNDGDYRYHFAYALPVIAGEPLAGGPESLVAGHFDRDGNIDLVSTVLYRRGAMESHDGGVSLFTYRPGVHSLTLSDVADIQDANFGNYLARPEVQAPAARLRVDRTRLPESDGVATLTVSLSSPTDRDVTVDLGFSGAARRDADYVVSDQVVIPAGEITKSTQIRVINDILDEDDETIIVEISRITNANESLERTAVTAIADNDATPTVTLQVNPVTIPEAGGAATFTATLSAPSGRNVNVPLSFAGSAEYNVDYVGSGEIVIPAGEIMGSIEINALNDALDEGDESIIAEIVNAANANPSAPRTAAVTIEDDDAALVLLTETVRERGIGIPGDIDQDGGVLFKDVAVLAPPDVFSKFVTLANNYGKYAAGTSFTLSIRLAEQPTSNVVFNITDDDSDDTEVLICLSESGSCGDIEITEVAFGPANWMISQFITVQGKADNEVDGDQQTTIRITVDAERSDDAFDHLPAQIIQVTTTDSSTAGFSVRQPLDSDDLNCEPRVPDLARVALVALDAQPMSDVRLMVVSDALAAPTFLVFHPENWQVPQCVTVPAAARKATISVVDDESDDAFDAVDDRDLIAVFGRPNLAGA